MRGTEFKETEMKSKKRYRKLLMQLMAIIFPLFMLMTAAIVWTVYNSTLDGFLEAQNDRIRELTIESLDSGFIFLDENYTSELQEWFFTQMEKEPFKYDKELSSEELHQLFEYQASHGDTEDYDWYAEMPEDIRRLYLREYFYTVQSNVEACIKGSDVNRLFLMDLSEEYQGLVLFDYNKDGESRKMGESFDLDLSKHPVIRDMPGSDSTEIVFEKTKDFPEAGSFYIGYRPIVIGGRTRAVLGLTYRWDDFKKTLEGTITKALIISVGGILIVLALLQLFLYRGAIRPVERIQKSVLDYTDDKDSEKIVGRMNEITARNELGYLSDVIADLALEIDHYTKENVRIAGERERAKKEQYEAEVQVMVSQIRPHFVYNTLSSIAILCDIDPKTAKEAAITFAKYLRGNMDALKQKAPVPFETELEHLKNYLYIEKLRFADALNVEYDIQTMDFELPILSIQPLVENAVKHGVGMKKYGGTVKISAAETDTAYEVVVSDDGVGFDPEAPKKEDGRTHVGMENTKKRLMDMCNADIVIESKVGEGTTARVIIPKTPRSA